MAERISRRASSAACCRGSGDRQSPNTVPPSAPTPTRATEPWADRRRSRARRTRRRRRPLPTRCTRPRHPRQHRHRIRTVPGGSTRWSHASRRRTAACGSPLTARSHDGARVCVARRSGDRRGDPDRECAAPDVSARIATPSSLANAFSFSSGKRSCTRPVRMRDSQPSPVKALSESNRTASPCTQRCSRATR